MTFSKSSTKKYGVVQSRNSSESLSTMDAEFGPKDCITFVHRPQRIRQRKTPATNLISRPPQKCCVNRFCAGIYNFFCRAKPAAVEDEDRLGNLKLKPPPIKYQSDRKSDESDANNSRRNMSVEFLHKCLSDDNAAGDYIIYVPRVSMSKLQRNYIEPLRQARFEPIILKTGSSANACRRCSTCVSCHMSRKSVMARSSNRSLNKLREKPPATFKVCNEMKPHEEHEENESAPEIVAEDGELPSTGSENRTSLLYIPSNSTTDFENFSFRIHEKTPSWTAYQMRHEAAFQKRQSILDATKERLRLQLEVCTRRKLIAEMKKSMNREKKSWTCSPPNMLESRFHHIHWLGNCGSHNLVGRYFDKEENNVVALKIFGEKPFDTILEDLDNRLMAIQEINSLTKLEHKNIVKLLGYFELQDKYHLILESCDHSLREEIQDSDSGLGALASKKIMKQLLNGLHFAHQTDCLHRDLSPENILVCKNGTVKICDFDRSIFITNSRVGSTSPTPGCFAYNSPEILAGDKEFGLPSDVWSLGVIFCELISGRTPFSNCNSAQSQLREIHKCVGPLMPKHASVAKLQADEKSYAVNNQAHLLQILATVSTLCRSFITKCLDVNPLCRYTCGELLQHPFIKGGQK